MWGGGQEQPNCQWAGMTQSRDIYCSIPREKWLFNPSEIVSLIEDSFFLLEVTSLSCCRHPLPDDILSSPRPCRIFCPMIYYGESDLKQVNLEEGQPIGGGTICERSFFRSCPPDHLSSLVYNHLGDMTS